MNDIPASALTTLLGREIAHNYAARNTVAEIQRSNFEAGREEGEAGRPFNCLHGHLEAAKRHMVADHCVWLHEGGHRCDSL